MQSRDFGANLVYVLELRSGVGVVVVVGVVTGVTNFVLNRI